MARWTIDQSMKRSLDGIVALRVRIVGGHVNILPTEDLVSFEVADVVGEPVLVTQEAGILNITYEDLTRGGLLDRLRGTQLAGYRQLNKRSATIYARVPRDCPVEVTTVSAGVVAAGLAARTTLRSASGDITLDDMGGEVDVNTASGNLDVRDVSGSLHFNSVSGQLAVAGGSVADFAGKTASGQLLADLDIAPAGRVRLGSISGDVALRVPAETSANIDLRTATGKLESAFGLERQDKPGYYRLGGGVGNGVDPAKITTTTVSGSVTLLRRDRDAPAAIPKGSE